VLPLDDEVEDDEDDDDVDESLVEVLLESPDDLVLSDAFPPSVDDFLA
jgi:hypothetical protein